MAGINGRNGCAKKTMQRSGFELHLESGMVSDRKLANITGISWML